MALTKIKFWCWGASLSETRSWLKRHWISLFPDCPHCWSGNGRLLTLELGWLQSAWTINQAKTLQSNGHWLLSIEQQVSAGYKLSVASSVSETSLGKTPPLGFLTSFENDKDSAFFHKNHFHAVTSTSATVILHLASRIKNRSLKQMACSIQTRTAWTFLWR